MITWEEAVESLRRDPAQAELVRACYYDDPLADAARRFEESEEWRALLQWLPAPGRALEIGAGRGIASWALARAGWSVTALEPDPSDRVGAGAIRALAAETGVAIDVVEDWGETLPFVGESFDLVYGRAVFHHARDLGAFCREAHRVLRPGGKLILTREHVLSFEDDLPRFLAQHPLHRLYGGEAAYTLERYLAALGEGGFKDPVVVGPKSSPVNFFPQTTRMVRDALKGRRRKRVGWWRSIISPMSTGDFEEEAALWERQMRTPGRLYSFLCRK